MELSDRKQVKFSRKDADFAKKVWGFWAECEVLKRREYLMTECAKSLKMAASVFRDRYNNLQSRLTRQKMPVLVDDLDVDQILAFEIKKHHHEKATNLPLTGII